MGYEFSVDEQQGNDGAEVFHVPSPNFLREVTIPLNTDGATQLGARLGVTPARASLSRWRKHGYPVDRGGPRVMLPYVVKLKSVCTSTRALHQFLEVVQGLQEEIQRAGGVDSWRTARRRSRGRAAAAKV